MSSVGSKMGRWYPFQADIWEWWGTKPECLQPVLKEVLNPKAGVVFKAQVGHLGDQPAGDDCIQYRTVVHKQQWCIWLLEAEAGAVIISVSVLSNSWWPRKRLSCSVSEALLLVFRLVFVFWLVIWQVPCHGPEFAKWLAVLCLLAALASLMPLSRLTVNDLAGGKRCGQTGWDVN